MKSCSAVSRLFASNGRSRLCPSGVSQVSTVPSASNRAFNVPTTIARSTPHLCLRRARSLTMQKLRLGLRRAGRTWKSVILRCLLNPPGILRYSPDEVWEVTVEVGVLLHFGNRRAPIVIDVVSKHAQQSPSRVPPAGQMLLKVQSLLRA